MLTHSLDRAAGILQVRPLGPLEAADFENLAAEVDPYIEDAGGLNGLLIEAPTFPGWENLGALLRHLSDLRARAPPRDRACGAGDGLQARRSGGTGGRPFRLR